MPQTRFDALKAKLADKPGVTDPAALAATIGRKKLGDKAFNARAAAGRRKKKQHPNTGLVEQYLKQK
jgi:hypothetical protein